MRHIRAKKLNRPVRTWVLGSAAGIALLVGGGVAAQAATADHSRPTESSSPAPVPAKPDPADPKPVPADPKPVPADPKPVPAEPKPVPAEPKPVPAVPANR